jgi:hypothetical protein
MSWLICSSILTPSFALEMNWISCNHLSHRLIAVCTWDHWSVVPSMANLLTEIALVASVVIGWQVKHFLIM